MKLVPFKINKISYFHPSRSYAVVLKEIGGSRFFPIMIGSYEAQSIAMAMEYIHSPRPLTHDLLINIINSAGGKLLSIKITDINDGIFYSVLQVEFSKLEKKEIDSRPSDAIVAALRSHCPILVNDKLLTKSKDWEDYVNSDSGNLLQKSGVESLENQLKKAIEKEEYEIAARIRDRLNDIED